MNKFKLGRTQDDYGKPKLDLTALVSAPDFSMVPATADPLSNFTSRLQMLGNGPDPAVGPNFEGAGDCEAARVANNRLLITGKYPVKPVAGGTTLDWVWDIYRTQNSGFDPLGSESTNGPGSGHDNGMSSDQLLDYLHKTGTPDGVKVVAYGTIDPTNIQAVERAIAASYGSVWFDILVQAGNEDEFDRGQPWTNTGQTPEGGHAVLGGGYIPQRRIATWAGEATLSESFWSGKFGNQPLVQRVYLVIWPEHGTEQFLSGESAALLAQQYQSLTGKTMAWPAPPTPQPTPPAPIPTPTSDGLKVADPIVLQHIQHAAGRAGLSSQDWLNNHLRNYFDIRGV